MFIGVGFKVPWMETLNLCGTDAQKSSPLLCPSARVETNYFDEVASGRLEPRQQLPLTV